MKGNEGMEWHLHLNSTFHLLWAPKRFTNPAEQNYLRKTSKWSRPSLPLYTLLHIQKHFTLLECIHVCVRTQDGRGEGRVKKKKSIDLGSKGGVRKCRQSKSNFPRRFFNIFLVGLILPAFISKYKSGLKKVRVWQKVTYADVNSKVYESSWSELNTQTSKELCSSRLKCPLSRSILFVYCTIKN